MLSLFWFSSLLPLLEDSQGGGLHRGSATFLWAAVHCGPWEISEISQPGVEWMVWKWICLLPHWALAWCILLYCQHNATSATSDFTCRHLKPVTYHDLVENILAYSSLVPSPRHVTERWATWNKERTSFGTAVIFFYLVCIYYWITTEHFVHQHSKCPIINAFIVPFASHNFRCKVLRCPTHRIPNTPPTTISTITSDTTSAICNDDTTVRKMPTLYSRAVLNLLRKSKIYNFDIPLRVNQKILRLQITVQRVSACTHMYDMI